MSDFFSGPIRLPTLPLAGYRYSTGEVFAEERKNSICVEATYINEANPALSASYTYRITSGKTADSFAVSRKDPGGMTSQTELETETNPGEVSKLEQQAIDQAVQFLTKQRGAAVNNDELIRLEELIVKLKKLASE
ncbi:MAG: hypothetical protein PHH14_02015 [Candidatus Margulisbacteria bacterium]|nr:hypothetical protein [Candidatus Margulisiibacteriota bacterium]